MRVTIQQGPGKRRAQGEFLRVVEDDDGAALYEVKVDGRKVLVCPSDVGPGERQARKKNPAGTLTDGRRVWWQHEIKDSDQTSLTELLGVPVVWIGWVKKDDPMYPGGYVQLDPTTMDRSNPVKWLGKSTEQVVANSRLAINERNADIFDGRLGDYLVEHPYILESLRVEMQKGRTENPGQPPRVVLIQFLEQQGPGPGPRLHNPVMDTPQLHAALEEDREWLGYEDTDALHRDLSAVVRQLPPDYKPAPSLYHYQVGKSVEIIYPTTRGVEAAPVRFVLLESDELVPSHLPLRMGVGAEDNPLYPPNLQERDYAADVQESDKVRRNALGFVPGLVINDNPDAINGPPVIDENGLVLGGNSRAMTIKLVYQMGLGEPLIEAIKAKAWLFGFTSADVAKYRQPVIARMVDIDARTDREMGRLWVRRFNVALTQAMSPAQSLTATAKGLTNENWQAISEIMAADMGPEDTLFSYLGSSRSLTLLRYFSSNNVIPDRIRSAYFDEDGLNRYGKRFVQDLLVGHLFAFNPALLAEMNDTEFNVFGTIAPYVIVSACCDQAWDVRADLIIGWNAASLAWRTGRSLEDSLTPPARVGFGGRSLFETAGIVEQSEIPFVTARETIRRRFFTALMYLHGKSGRYLRKGFSRYANKAKYQSGAQGALDLGTFGAMSSFEGLMWAFDARYTFFVDEADNWGQEFTFPAYDTIRQLPADGTEKPSRALQIQFDIVRQAEAWHNDAKQADDAAVAQDIDRQREIVDYLHYGRKKIEELQRSADRAAGGGGETMGLFGRSENPPRRPAAGQAGFAFGPGPSVAPIIPLQTALALPDPREAPAPRQLTSAGDDYRNCPEIRELNYSTWQLVPKAVRIWFVADLADRGANFYRQTWGRPVNVRIREAIEAARRFALGQINKATLDMARSQMHSYLLRIHQDRNRSSADRELDKLVGEIIFEGIRGPGGIGGPPFHDYNELVRYAATGSSIKDQTNPAIRQSEEAYKLARLRYLCELWGMAGERGLLLLEAGEPPIEPPLPPPIGQLDTRQANPRGGFTPYPWSECIKDQTARYGAAAAPRICGSIRSRSRRFENGRIPNDSAPMRDHELTELAKRYKLGVCVNREPHGYVLHDSYNRSYEIGESAAEARDRLHALGEARREYDDYISARQLNPEASFVVPKNKGQLSHIEGRFDLADNTFMPSSAESPYSVLVAQAPLAEDAQHAGRLYRAASLLRLAQGQIGRAAFQAALDRLALFRNAGVFPATEYTAFLDSIMPGVPQLEAAPPALTAAEEARKIEQADQVYKDIDRARHLRDMGLITDAQFADLEGLANSTANQATGKQDFEGQVANVTAMVDEWVAMAARYGSAKPGEQTYSQKNKNMINQLQDELAAIEEAKEIEEGDFVKIRGDLYSLFGANNMGERSEDLTYRIEAVRDQMNNYRLDYLRRKDQWTPEVEPSKKRTLSRPELTDKQLELLQDLYTDSNVKTHQGTLKALQERGLATKAGKISAEGKKEAKRRGLRLVDYYGSYDSDNPDAVDQVRAAKIEAVQDPFFSGEYVPPTAQAQGKPQKKSKVAAPALPPLQAEEIPGYNKKRIDQPTMFQRNIFKVRRFIDLSRYIDKTIADHPHLYDFPTCCKKQVTELFPPPFRVETGVQEDKRAFVRLTLQEAAAWEHQPPYYFSWKGSAKSIRAAVKALQAEAAKWGARGAKQLLENIEDESPADVAVLGFNIERKEEPKPQPKRTKQEAAEDLAVAKKLRLIAKRKEPEAHMIGQHSRDIGSLRTVARLIEDGPSAAERRHGQDLLTKYDDYLGGSRKWSERPEYAARVEDKKGGALESLGNYWEKADAIEAIEEYPYPASYVGRVYFQGKVISTFYPGKNQIVQPQAELEVEEARQPGDYRADIPYDRAYAAYRASSHTPDKRAKQTIEGYQSDLENFKAELDALAKTEDQKILVDTEFDRYRQGYRERYLAKLDADSRTMSSMITGPSNFPTRSNQKKLDTADKRTREWLEYIEKQQRAIKRQLRPEHLQPVMSDDADAVQKLQKKIDEAERLQQIYKDANKILRSKQTDDEQKVALIMALGNGLPEKTARDLLKPDYAGRVGFASYVTTNNLANIKRMKGRIVELERRKDDESKEWTFDGGTVTDDVDDHRLRIFFDDKPSADWRKALKSSGWRWSPNVGAWQRKRGPNAKQSLNTLFRKWGLVLVEEVDEEVSPPLAAAPEVAAPQVAAPQLPPPKLSKHQQEVFDEMLPGKRYVYERGEGTSTDTGPRFETFLPHVGRLGGIRRATLDKLADVGLIEREFDSASGQFGGGSSIVRYIKPDNRAAERAEKKAERIADIAEALAPEFEVVDLTEPITQQLGAPTQAAAPQLTTPQLEATETQAQSLATAGMWAVGKDAIKEFKLTPRQVKFLQTAQPGEPQTGDDSQTVRSLDKKGLVKQIGFTVPLRFAWTAPGEVVRDLLLELAKEEAERAAFLKDCPYPPLAKTKAKKYTKAQWSKIKRFRSTDWPSEQVKQQGERLATLLEKYNIKFKSWLPVYNHYGLSAEDYVSDANDRLERAVEQGEDRTPALWCREHKRLLADLASYQEGIKVLLDPSIYQLEECQAVVDRFKPVQQTKAYIAGQFILKSILRGRFDLYEHVDDGTVVDLLDGKLTCADVEATKQAAQKKRSEDSSAYFERLTNTGLGVYPYIEGIIYEGNKLTLGNITRALKGSRFKVERNVSGDRVVIKGGQEVFYGPVNKADGLAAPSLIWMLIFLHYNTKRKGMVYRNNAQWAQLQEQAIEHAAKYPVVVKAESSLDLPKRIDPYLDSTREANPADAPSAAQAARKLDFPAITEPQREALIDAYRNLEDAADPRTIRALKEKGLLKKTHTEAELTKAGAAMVEEKILPARRIPLDPLEVAPYEVGLRNKAQESGIAYPCLLKVFKRGVYAGERIIEERAIPGIHPYQWAYDRVDKFIEGRGTFAGADSDIAVQAGLL